MLAQVLVEKLAQGRQAEESEVKLDYLMAEEWAHSKAVELVAMLGWMLVEARSMYRIQKCVPRLQ